MDLKTIHVFIAYPDCFSASAIIKTAIATTEKAIQQSGVLLDPDASKKATLAAMALAHIVSAQHLQDKIKELENPPVVN